MEVGQRGIEMSLDVPEVRSAVQRVQVGRDGGKPARLRDLPLSFEFAG
jgi:hypothetical protein